MGIRKKMAKGAFWLVLEKGTQQLLGFIVFSIIASQIGPEEYGLVALCTVAISLVNRVIMGLVDSIISMKIRDDERLSSLFWFVLSIAVSISTIYFFLANVFAQLFGNEKLESLLQVFCVIPILYGLAAVPTGLITSNMDFKIFTIRALVASVLGGGAGVYLAYAGWGAYAIAIQQIIVQLATVVILFMSHSWRPKLLFRSFIMRDILRLGFGQSSSSMISFIEQHVPRLLLGYFISPAAVGSFAFVQRILSVFQEGIVIPILNVVYPALATIVNKPNEEKAIIQQTVYVISSMLFPVVVGVILTAPIFVPYFFGDKWTESSLLMQIYAPSVIFISFVLLIKNILRAHQSILISLRLQTVLALLSTIGVLLIAPYGGVIWVTVYQVLLSMLSVIIFSKLLSTKLKISIWSNSLTLFPSVLSSITIIGPVLLVYHFTVSNGSDGIIMTLSIAAGILSYVTVFMLLERKRIYGIVSNLRRVIK